MILYSALYPDFYPFNKFHPGAELVTLDAGESPASKDGYLIIWGGGDIHPSQYGRQNRGSHVDANPSRRDLEEERMARDAIKLGLPIVGVCRGAQLACAIAGGILVQNVTGHSRDHLITTTSGKRILSSSLHHQLMYPWDVPKFEVLAHATPSRSDVYEGLEEREELVAAYEPEPEVIYFPEIAALAIQGHPEFMEVGCDFNQYVRGLIHDYVQR